VEPDTEIPSLLGNGSRTFPGLRVHKQSVTTDTLTLTLTQESEETSGHETQPGLDTKTDRLTDRQLQCDFLTLTVTLRVVRGDERGSLESEIVKYGHEFYGTRTRN
jgi:hypothetical protein